ncbi:MAG: hypothetical protein IKA31_00130 [Clostridia bacterium]|nr:hypothetical protein [Clostridia bacterium]
MDNDSRIKDIIYKRRNGADLVNDPEAIRSCKTEQSRDVIDNARLGSYDKYGNYVIIPDIKRELISMPKIVYSTNNTSNGTVYDLKGSIPIFGDVFFKLTIGKNEATLSLTESVNREAGGYLEVYDESIDSLALGKDRLPNSIIFRNYHVIDKPEDYGKKENYEYSNILTRKVYLSLLSKELRAVSNIDEHEAFENMVSTLKSGGTYGKKVLNEFVTRLKDRPAVFEISDSDHYNKAVNEILLSSLDVATTDDDKDNVETRQIYLDVINARNQNIEGELQIANSRVDEKYVRDLVRRASDEFEGKQEITEEDAAEEFFEKLGDKKRAAARRRTLEKPMLKQGKESKEEEAKTKEEKLKQLLDKKEKDKKKTPANKKLKAAKGKTASKKLKAGKKKTASKGKKKVAKKGAKKAKLKNKKKKVKKAKNQAKAKGKGKSFSSKPAGAKAKKKKQQKKSFKWALHVKDEVKENEVQMNFKGFAKTSDKHEKESHEETIQSIYSNFISKIKDQNTQLSVETIKGNIEKVSSQIAKATPGGATIPGQENVETPNPFFTGSQEFVKFGSNQAQPGLNNNNQTPADQIITPDKFGSSIPTATPVTPTMASTTPTMDPTTQTMGPFAQAAAPIDPTQDQT